MEKNFDVRKYGFFGNFRLIIKQKKNNENFGNQPKNNEFKHKQYISW